MDRRAVWTALALACLLLGACKDKRDPLKPTVATPAAVVAAAPAAPA
ncbi:MAG: hypothetical protein QFF03_06215 [Pseudomonadota bacterium]|nr:hypothetical protein [Pseudomonadota bacterium]